jgi:sugar diacid utilization regulator
MASSVAFGSMHHFAGSQLASTLALNTSSNVRGNVATSASSQNMEVAHLLEAVDVAQRLLAYACSSRSAQQVVFYEESALTLELSVSELLRHADYSTENRDRVTAALSSLHNSQANLYGTAPPLTR